MHNGSCTGSVESDPLLSDVRSHHGAEKSSKISENQKIIGTDIGFNYYKIVGKVLIVCEWVTISKSFRLIVIGPDWPFVLITYSVLIVPSFAVQQYLLTKFSELIIFYVLVTSCIITLTIVFIKDPGLGRSAAHSLSRFWTYCDQCESFRPPGTVHCSTCQVCVVGYDHHCPWTGKCVGRGNIVYFKLFLMSVAWLVVFIIVLGIMKIIMPGDSDNISNYLV